VHVPFETVFHHVLWVLLVMLVVMFLIMITSSKWKWHCGVEGHWFFDLGSVEIWGDNAGFVHVSEHLEDVRFFQFFSTEDVLVSFKLEVEIHVIIKLEWLEDWLNVTLWINPELLWIHAEVNGGLILFLHDGKFLSNNLGNDIVGEVFADDQRE